MPTFTLNFSRPGNQVVGQYYNFIRLGRSGYTKIMKTLQGIALDISSRIAAIGPFSIACRKTIHHVPTTALRISANGLTIGYSAFVSEIFRAGIQSISTGQMEAARSLGMPRASTCA